MLISFPFYGILWLIKSILFKRGGVTMSVVSIRKITPEEVQKDPVILMVDESSGQTATGAIKECPCCHYISMKAMDPLDAAEERLTCGMCGYTE